MKNILLVTLFLIAVNMFTVPQIICAAEIVVEPGISTLSNAIAAAAEGDVMILKDGIYTVPAGYSGGSYYDYIIDKTLTIRAESKSIQPILGVNIPTLGINISYAAEVTFQGITFLSPLHGGKFKVIECQFAFTATTSQLVDAADVILIGNHFQPSDIYEYSYVQINGSENIVAGNTFTNVYLNNTSSTSWTIGNSFEITSPNSSKAISTGGNTYCFIAGNRIQLNLTGPYNGAIITGGSYKNLIAGNSIFLNVPDASLILGVSAGSSVGRADIVNNVIYRSGVAPLSSNYFPISNPGLGTISGNILVGHNATEMINAPYAKITNNICFSNQDACGTQSGITVVDPMFEDLIDFRLAAGSPAIDAGPVDYVFSDLDRSRNDIGAYGGPWSIEQYDVQRNQDRTTPFVYPLFETPITANLGQLPVRAIGAARLQ